MADVQLLMTWDIREGRQQSYLEFILGEFVPGLQRLGGQITGAWYTQAGNGPMIRVTVAVADAAAAHTLLASADFQRLRDRLLQYVEHFQCRITRVKN